MGVETIHDLSVNSRFVCNCIIQRPVQTAEGHKRPQGIQRPKATNGPQLIGDHVFFPIFIEFTTIKTHVMVITRILLLSLFSLIMVDRTCSQDTQPQTYCNPVNLDYTYMIYNAHSDLSYRSGADPAIVEFRNEYYLFVTR